MKRRTLLTAAGMSGLSSGVRAQARGNKRLARRLAADQQDRPRIFEGDGDTPSFPQNPGDHPASLPYLYFPIHPGDFGDPNAARTTMPGYADRKPSSIEWRLKERVVLLHVANGGKAASDLFRVDYQIVYCTLSSHKPGEGFSTSHAGEAEGSTADDLLTADFVLPGTSKAVVINLDPFPSLRNIYVRARVATLLSPIVNMKDWDFSRDPQVVEGWTAYQGP